MSRRCTRALSGSSRNSTPRKQALNARLAELGAAVVAAKQRVRDAEIAQRRVEADVARLRDAVIDAHADGDEARAAKARSERATLERDGLPEAVERFEGARLALQRAEIEVGAFAVEHLDGLLSELRPDAVRVAEAVEEAVEQLSRAMPNGTLSSSRRLGCCGSRAARPTG
jgi:hypothetical protein